MSKWCTFLRTAVLTRWGYLTRTVVLARTYLAGGIVGLTLWFGIGLLPFPNVEVQFRVAGLIFQLLGLSVVVWGLSDARKLFRRSGIGRGFLEWCRTLGHVFFPPKPKRAYVDVGGTSHVSLSAASTKQEHGVDDSIEGRMKRLEQRIDSVDADIRRLHAEGQKDREVVRKRIDAETAARADGDQQLKRHLEEAVIGGIHIEILGLVYLFVGIVLATVPGELLAALNALKG